MDRVAAALTFNGPLEAGIRSVALLCAAYPHAFDIGQLTALDYLLVRTSELNGPESLHPPSPIQSPNATVRRQVVQNGVDLMISRELVERRPCMQGIVYMASDSAVPFLEALSGSYLMRVKERADWIVSYFEGQPRDAVTERVRALFDKWVMEFQNIERSLGAPE